MKTQQIPSTQHPDLELSSLGHIFQQVYHKKTKQISYSDTYNTVYKLCKKGLSQQILKQLYKISNKHYQQIINNIDIQHSQITDYLTLFNQLNQALQRITQILLYVQSNYINQPKREYHSIKNMLQSTFFQTLCQNGKVLKKISQKIVQTRISSKNQQILPLIQQINALDQKQLFYPEYLMQYYITYTSQNIKTILTQNYKTLDLTTFLTSSRMIFIEQKQWLQKHFQRIKCKKYIQSSIQKIYENSFNQIKSTIYLQNSQQIFKTHILDFLSLLNQKNSESQINTYNQWYLSQIKKRISLLDRTDNSKFLTSFITQYLSISHSLLPIKNFNISYKATFFLQHWINQQSIQLPKRLNIYLQQLLSNPTNPISPLTNFSILFKFLKQKDTFEKQYRRLSAMRLLYNPSTSNITLQHSLIQQMEKQCGSDWVNKLKLMTTTHSDTQFFPNSHPSSLHILIFNDICWPFDKIKCQTTYPGELNNLLASYKQKYQQKHKGRLLKWYPLQGYSLLQIKFDAHTQQFKMDIIMSTILLHLQQLKYKSTINEILTSTNFSLSDIIDQLQTLQKQGIIKMEVNLKDSKNKDTPIQLNLSYTPTNPSPLLDFTQHYLELQLTQKTGQQQLRAERRMMVEALIIKIMKSNKIIKLQQLYKQITPMIENRGFKFNQKFVQNTFNGLIDKRYIRDVNNGNYTYLAS